MTAAFRWFENLPPRTRPIVFACGVLFLGLVGWGTYSLLLVPDGAEETAGTSPNAEMSSTDSSTDDAEVRAGAETAEEGNIEDVASFDVVQIDPTGSVVIAGRTTPGATVRVLSDNQVLAEERADARGEFVFVPDTQLEPGVHELELAVDTSEGERRTRNKVVVTVPERPRPGVSAPDEPVVSVLVAPDGRPLRVLQGPDAAVAADGALALETITHGEEGEVTLTGRSEVGTTVTVYADEEALGTVTTDKEGNWRIDTDKIDGPNTYELRVDQVGTDGTLTARIEATFVHTGTVAPASKVVMVHPGQSLWAISRKIYGRGILYTLIYDSNNYQIADPALIYPGQLFIVPEGG